MTIRVNSGLACHSGSDRCLVGHGSDGKASANWLKASATIETALLAPLILLVIFAVITLDFFTVSAVTCRSASCEQAVSGKVYEDLFLPGSAAASRSGGDDESLRTVKFASETAMIYGTRRFAIEEEAVYKKVHPVKAVRVSRAAAGLIRQIAAA